MRTLLIVSVWVLALLVRPAIAESPRIVGPLPGYRCMMLNLSAEQSMDPDVHVPFFTAPMDSSPVAGYASLEVAVRDPIKQVSGFVEARLEVAGQIRTCR